MCRNTPNCTIMLCYLCDVIITSDIIIGSIVSVLVFHCSVMSVVHYNSLAHSVARGFFI